MSGVVDGANLAYDQSRLDTTVLSADGRFEHLQAAHALRYLARSQLNSSVSLLPKRDNQGCDCLSKWVARRTATDSVMSENFGRIIAWLEYLTPGPRASAKSPGTQSFPAPSDGCRRPCAAAPGSSGCVVVRQRTDQRRPHAIGIESRRLLRNLRNSLDRNCATRCLIA